MQSGVPDVESELSLTLGPRTGCVTFCSVQFCFFYYKIETIIEPTSLVIVRLKCDLYMRVCIHT